MILSFIQPCITIVGFVALVLAVYREARILKIVSENSDISETAMGAAINAPLIALLANVGRLKIFVEKRIKHKFAIFASMRADIGNFEDKYHRNFSVILGIVILVLINFAYLGKYIRDTAAVIGSMLDRVDGTTVVLGYGVLLQYIGFGIVAFTISEIIDCNVKRQKPDQAMVHGKRVLSFREELPPALPAWSKPMSTEEYARRVEPTAVELAAFKDPPEKIYPDDARAELRAIARDPEAARAYLLEQGFIDENGALTNRFDNK